MDLTISPHGPGGRCVLQRHATMDRLRWAVRVRWAVGTVVFLGTLAAAMVVLPLVLPVPARPANGADDFARHLLLPLMMALAMSAFTPLVLEPWLERRTAPAPCALTWRDGVLEVDGRRLELAALQWQLDDAPTLRDGRSAVVLEGVVLEPSERDLLDRTFEAARRDARARFASGKVPAELRRLLEDGGARSRLG